ncbi:MAG: membrane associated rhomboid family serine protease [Planctomycetota bacterium]|jgi:membrane associated rhomboid family serine protease
MAWSDRQYSDNGPLYGGMSSQKSVCFWIIAVTVAIQAVIWVAGAGARGEGAARVVDWFALEWDYLFSLQLWRYVTYIFLHGGVGHLFWNMFLLYLMGQMLEPHMERRQFLIVYLGLGVVAAFGYPIEAAFQDPPHRGVIGASGSIMGLVALFGARFPRVEVRMIFVTVTGAGFAAIMIGLDILSLMASPGGTGTAHGVHLAGAAGGLVYGLWWTKIEIFFGAAKVHRERKKAGKMAAQKHADAEEMDRILEKISAEGIGELTEAERDFLRQQSERLKSRS